MGALAGLFESSPESPFQVERCLLASWKSLLRIKAYEEVRSPPPNAVVTCSCIYPNKTETHHTKLASYQNLRGYPPLRAQRDC